MHHDDFRRIAIPERRLNLFFLAFCGIICQNLLHMRVYIAVSSWKLLFSSILWKTRCISPLSHSKPIIHFHFCICSFVCEIVTLVVLWLFMHIGMLLWSPYVIGQTIIFLPCSFFLLSFFLLFFPSPNLSGRRLDVYHTLAHGVALVRI